MGTGKKYMDLCKNWYGKKKNMVEEKEKKGRKRMRITGNGYVKAEDEKRQNGKRRL